jgi:hypothetical protein
MAKIQMEDVMIMKSISATTLSLAMLSSIFANPAFAQSRIGDYSLGSTLGCHSIGQSRGFIRGALDGGRGVRFDGGAMEAKQYYDFVTLDGPTGVPVTVGAWKDKHQEGDFYVYLPERNGWQHCEITLYSGGKVECEPGSFCYLEHSDTSKWTRR